MNAASAPPKLSMLQLLVCGAAIVTLSMGIRHGFGLLIGIAPSGTTYAAVMGVLWLSTVPPTNAIAANIFGVQSC